MDLYTSSSSLSFARDTVHSDIPEGTTTFTQISIAKLYMSKSISSLPKLRYDNILNFGTSA